MDFSCKRKKKKRGGQPRVGFACRADTSASRWQHRVCCPSDTPSRSQPAPRHPLALSIRFCCRRLPLTCGCYCLEGRGGGKKLCVPPRALRLFFARKHRIAIGRPINIREWLPKNHKSHEKRRSGAGSPVLVCVSRRTPRRPAGNIGSAARLTRPLDRSRTGGFVSRGATARPRTTSVFTSKPAPKITNGNECRESHECGRALSRVPSSGGGVLSRVRPSWMPAAYLVIRRQQPRDRPLTLSIRSHS